MLEKNKAVYSRNLQIGYLPMAIEMDNWGSTWWLRRCKSLRNMSSCRCWRLILARYKVKGFSTWENFISPSGITLMFRLSTFDLISVAEAVLRVTKFNILSAFWPITSSIWPQMKECSKGIVFVSSRQSIFMYKSSQSEFICKSYSQYGLDRSETKILRLTLDTCW